MAALISSIVVASLVLPRGYDAFLVSQPPEVTTRSVRPCISYRDSATRRLLSRSWRNSCGCGGGAQSFLNALAAAPPSSASSGNHPRTPRPSTSAATFTNDHKVDGVGQKHRAYRHTLAVLVFPRSSADRIANEAILEKAIAATRGTLSVVLRCRDNLPHRTPLSALCSFVGEVYSKAWDTACEKALIDDVDDLDILDVVVYPQSLPNAAPEQWIYQRWNLDCICGTDDMMGWHSVSLGPTTNRYAENVGDGRGGLQAHCDAVNADRVWRGLNKVTALHVNVPNGAQAHPDVAFLEDDRVTVQRKDGGDAMSIDEEDNTSRGLMGGARLDDESLFNYVAVGGTFDGMHYGHRKLLTLAVSAVAPTSGNLLVGVTSDEMLRQKSFSELIPTVQNRIESVREFLDKLAPGLKNRRKIVPISDAFGPPATDHRYDALVLSDETLRNGQSLNEQRLRLGMTPLKLLCTRRTEPNGMSSTALRRMKAARRLKTKANPGER